MSVPRSPLYLAPLHMHVLVPRPLPTKNFRGAGSLTQGSGLECKDRSNANVKNTFACKSWFASLCLYLAPLPTCMCLYPPPTRGFPEQLFVTQGGGRYRHNPGRMHRQDCDWIYDEIDVLQGYAVALTVTVVVRSSLHKGGAVQTP